MRSGLTLVSLSVLVGLLSLAGGSQADEGARPQSTGMGALAGDVTSWPAWPVQGPGMASGAAPAPGVKIMIYRPGRQEITSVTTDEHGHYRVNLPPGPYLIEMAPEKGKRFSKDLPATVVITRGRETRLNIRLDSRMR